MRKLVSVLAVFGLSVACTAAAHAGGACCKSGQAAKASLASGGSSCQSGQTAVAGATAEGKQVIAGACCASKKGSTACTETSMPQIAYKIGDKILTCPVEARSAASADDNAQVKYVVGGKEYDDQMSANKAYDVVLSSYIKDMVTVREVPASAEKKCPVSGSTIEKAQPAHFELATYSFPTREAAEKAAAEAKEAATKIRMSYAVADKTYSCPDEAKKACTGDAKVEYVVGDVKSCCDVLASIELSKARIAAASKAIADAAGKATASRM